jgi:hypothetical protein
MNLRNAFLLVAVSLALCTSTFAAPPAHLPKMSWLDNGVIRLGVDLDLGGAITWLSRSGDQVNLINSFDWGRQVQMSFYGGPVPYGVGDRQPRADWAGLGWNPIQSGDTYGHRSKVLEQRNDGRALYVKCVPMQWPLENVPAECTIESWLELDGSAVIARGRLVNARADQTAYSAHLQELPAVYTNAPWHRIYTYSGAHPFAGEPVREIPARPPPRWSRWTATENWSALLDDAGWGLGVWNPGALEFGGGFNGAPGRGGAGDPECGYLAPNRVEILDHDIDYTFRYELILGTLEQIRARVYAHSRDAAVTAWDFTKGRQSWICRNATDSGWRGGEAFEVKWSAADPSLQSPLFFRRAEEVGTLVIEAAFTTAEKKARVYWSTLQEPGMDEAHAVSFAIQGDGVMRTYTVTLSDSPRYHGGLMKLRLDPAEQPPGSLRLRSVRLEK